MTAISAATSAGPEMELLLCCAQTVLSPDNEVRMRSLLKRNIDWAALMRLAEQHRIRPLLYWRLKDAGENVPRSVLDRLGSQFRNSVRLNLSLTAELLELQRLLEAYGIRPIPFKGPVLAQAVYGSPALREFVDLDILVDQADVPKAKALLIGRGYRASFDLTGGQESGYLNSQCEYHFTHDNSGLVVEIHWRLFPRYFTFPLNQDMLRRRLQPVLLGQCWLQTFSPEDLLLYLCAHGAKHNWSRLAWVCDISEMIRACPEMDWPRVIQEARVLGGERMLYLGLFLAANLLEAELPDRVWQQIHKDSTLAAMARYVELTMAREPDGPTGAEGNYLRTLAFPLRVRERRRDQVVYCARLLIYPTNGDTWERVRLPPSLFPLYYFWRPISLILRYKSHLVKYLLPSWLVVKLNLPGGRPQGARKQFAKGD